MKMEGDTLILQSVICKEKLSLREVISRINIIYTLFVKWLLNMV